MPELPALVQALLNPRAYPEPSHHIELEQTQLSFAFLTGDYVYKVKKAVDFGFLDFTTLEKRRFFCEQEVVLNRRLCPDIYLGVVAITRQGRDIAIGGDGEVIEYAVKMRQLPRERMMDRLLPRGQVTPGMVERVAGKVADFHSRAEVIGEERGCGGLETVLVNTEENFVQTEKYIGVSIPENAYHAIKSYSDCFVEENASLFTERVRRGRVRDCHGDLHAAHVCFCNDICIYDCIEFNDRFRYGDVASEVAFLAMDLDHYGRVNLSRQFVNAYMAASQDAELETLLNFYKCYRAYVRGKVEGFKLDDPHIAKAEKEKILAIARDYFELADSYTMQSGSK